MDERFDRTRGPRDRRLDHWLETGRQFVDGVSGRRPGQRKSALDLDSVGRWVGEKVDWLLEEDDEWREPWQENKSRMISSGGKRPLDAISLRGQQPAPAHSPRTSSNDLDGDWPEDDSFRVQRWERSSDLQTSAEIPSRQVDDAGSASSPRRPLPRSSRRRD